MNTQPFSWTPHEITGVEASEDAPRYGFVGRAAAIRIEGIECVVLCRTDVDLAKVGKTLCLEGFDLDRIYKATLIHSTGIDVVIPPVQPETPPAAPIVTEVKPTPTSTRADVPVREDGEPVATYKVSDGNGPVPIEDHGDFPDAVTNIEDDDEL